MNVKKYLIKITLIISFSKKNIIGLANNSHFEQ